MLQRYLESLSSLGFIECSLEEEMRVYKITQKGFDLLRQYLFIRHQVILAESGA